MTFFGLYAMPAQNPPASAGDPSRILSQAVGPFIQKNCQTCHNTNLPSGSVDMQQLLAAPDSLAEQHDTWQSIAYQIQSGRMPSNFEKLLRPWMVWRIATEGGLRSSWL